MSNEMNNLFVAENNAQATSTRGLSGTAQLTNIASDVANKIISVMNANIEEYIEDIKKSQVDNNAMDTLIEKVSPLSSLDADLDFLRKLSDEVLEGMLKSQQSKRSRCKSKAMTMDNYKSLMVGAIAENLIRLVTGKEKSSGGFRRTAGSVEYTIEQLQQLGEDQEKLKKEIRNVQSKKSIMKSKADFDENDERYQQLLKVEQQLKDMRVGTTTEVIEVDTTKNELADMFSGVDLTHINAKDSKALLAQVAALVHGQQVHTEESNADEHVEE